MHASSAKTKANSPWESLRTTDTTHYPTPIAGPSRQSKQLQVLARDLPELYTAPGAPGNPQVNISYLSLWSGVYRHDHHTRSLRFFIFEIIIQLVISPTSLSSLQPSCYPFLLLFKFMASFSLMVVRVCTYMCVCVCVYIHIFMSMYL